MWTHAPSPAHTLRTPFAHVAQALPLYCLPLVLPFIIGKGLADANIHVSLASLDAGREIMKQYGSVAVADLQPILEVSGVCVRECERVSMHVCE